MMDERGAQTSAPRDGSRFSKSVPLNTRPAARAARPELALVGLHECHANEKEHGQNHPDRDRRESGDDSGQGHTGPRSLGSGNKAKNDGDDANKDARPAPEDPATTPPDQGRENRDDPDDHRRDGHSLSGLTPAPSPWTVVIVILNFLPAPAPPDRAIIIVLLISSAAARAVVVLVRVARVGPAHGGSISRRLKVVT
jgi:hypothetical protein